MSSEKAIDRIGVQDTGSWNPPREDPGQAIDEMKEIGDLIKKAGDIDLYRRIVKLEGEVIDLTRAKREADEKRAQLEEALKFKDELTFKDHFYWRNNGDGPYCTGCWDSKRSANRVVRIMMHNIGPQMQCPVCKHNYGRPRIS